MGNANRELTVKVKADISTTSMNPSQAAYPGSPLLTGGGTPGAAGGANATGSGNPLAQNALKAAEGLKSFDHHLAKTTESLAAVRESSKGMLGALKQAVFGGSEAAGGSPGHLQALMGGAKQFLGKFGTPMAIGGTALGVAGGIVSGVNAADNFMVSRGAKPWLGHGSWDRDASGRLYDWSPTRLANQAEVALIGGGTINSRGDIRTWDQQHDVIKNQFSEAMRRTSMQAPFAAINAGVSNQFSNLRVQQASLYSGYKGYQGYSSDAGFGADKYMEGMHPLLRQSRSSLEMLHGKDIGALMAAQETFGATVSAQGYGQQLAEAKAAHRTNMGNVNNTEEELRNEQARLAGFQRNVAPGDKGMASKEQEESLKRIEELKRKLISLNEQDLQIQDRIKSLTNEQVKAQKDMVSQKLAGVMGQRLQEAQTLQGQKEAFGMMDEGDQIYHKDIAERFKKGGIAAITSEERGILQNSPLGEDVRIQARKVADDNGFADIVRGSRAEARGNELADQQGKLEQLQVALTKTVNINVETEKTELAKAVTEAVGKLILSLQVSIQNSADLQTKAANNNAMAAGYQRADGNNPGR